VIAAYWWPLHFSAYDWQTGVGSFRILIGLSYQICSL